MNILIQTRNNKLNEILPASLQSEMKIQIYADTPTVKQT